MRARKSAAPANAGPVCAGAGQPTVTVAKLPGTALEGITVDPAGRAFVADLVSGQVFRIDAPGAPAVPIAKVPPAERVRRPGSRTAASYLYVSRTFTNPGVSRIPTDAPWAPQSLLDLSGGDVLAAAEGLTLDSAERPC